jgi:hypothetical protein
MKQRLKAQKLAAVAGPACKLCAKPTRFVGLESIPHNDQADLCTYECSQCGRVQTSVAALAPRTDPITDLIAHCERGALVMEALHAKLERLCLDAEDCELIAKLATDLKKRAMFAKVAVQLRTIAPHIELISEIAVRSGPSG